MKKDDTIAQNLLFAFMKFNRSNLKQTKTEGRNPSEIALLVALIRGKETGDNQDPAVVVRMINEFQDNGPTTAHQLEGLKVSEISNILRVKAPTITPVIRGLEEQGLIERKMDPEDRRVMRITITHAGRQAMRDIHNELVNNVHDLIEFLGEEDSMQLANLLTRVYEYQDRKRTESQKNCKDRPSRKGSEDA
ncbi:MarR family transcriptional regulator [Neobacillus mesonae]|nr:MarR family transcriptional regulator [Neobacillus mesonae]